MKLINIKLLVLFVFCYSIALVVLTPLQWVMPIAEPYLTNAGLTLTQVKGNIWDGESTIRHRKLGTAQLNWKVKIGQMLLIRLPVEVSIKNSDLDLNAFVAVSPFGITVNNLNGHIDDVAAKPYYTPYKVTISGRLQLNDVSANSGWSNKLGDISGDLSWSGGPIAFPMGRNIQNYTVPTMLGTLTSDEEQWLFTVKSTDNDVYMNANLTREGIGGVSIKRSIATAMEIPIPGNGSSLFDASDRVF